eukprot:Nitzschia sp. Nitz4//scaffold369_size34440//7903//8907//NITZ4_007839-RA/size34440-processed-gene-0.23-mRNA-1//-1//CDS//3329549356//2021//frame0
MTLEIVMPSFINTPITERRECSRPPLFLPYNNTTVSSSSTVALAGAGSPSLLTNHHQERHGDGNLCFSDYDIKEMALICEPTPIHPDQNYVKVVQNVSIDLFLSSEDTSLVSSISSLVIQTNSRLARSYFDVQAGMPRGHRGSFNHSPRGQGHSKREHVLEHHDSMDTSQGTTNSSVLRNCHVDQWNLRFDELLQFRKRHHHCCVPLQWPENPSLAHWIKRQRYQYRLKMEGRHSSMTQEREDALNRVGFVWDSHAVAWEERWNELRSFKEIYGHPNVPKKYPENPQLAVWVKCQRRQYKLFCQKGPSNMTEGRIEKLKSIGFIFNPRLKKRSY